MTTQLKSLNANLEVLNTQLEEAQDDLYEKISERDNLEINKDDFIDQYEESLDECNGEFMGYDASYILKNVDPIAYSLGLTDYCDSVDITVTEEYKNLQEEVEDLESDIEDLEIGIEALEEEIEDLESEEGL